MQGLLNVTHACALSIPTVTIRDNSDITLHELELLAVQTILSNKDGVNSTKLDPINLKGLLRIV